MVSVKTGEDDDRREEAIAFNVWLAFLFGKFLRDLSMSECFLLVQNFKVLNKILGLHKYDFIPILDILIISLALIS